MTWKQLGSACALGTAFWLTGSLGNAQEATTWRPIAQPNTPTRAVPIASTPVTLGSPVPLAELGRPAVLGTPAAGLAANSQDSRVTTASFEDLVNPVFRGQAPEPPPPPPPPPPGTPLINPGAVSAGPANQGWWGKCKGWFDFCKNDAPCNRGFLESDHAFDNLISPVSSPFFAEDPRALTELRPLAIYQYGPNYASSIGHSNSEFFGLQGRVALTENWSIVMNKLGFVGFQPDNSFGPARSDVGFAEVNIGPKWTFLRDSCSNTVAAVGLTFQLPIGSAKVFQDTGTLGLDPYLSIAHGFRLPSGYGGLNLLGTFGYDFSTDNERTEFTHLNLHLDYNIANANKFYPLIELNWYHVTQAGNNIAGAAFEGGDLFNLGASDSGARDTVTMAFGLRYKFSEHLQLGGVVEVPITGQKDLTEFRVGVDLIWRY